MWFHTSFKNQVLNLTLNISRTSLKLPQVFFLFFEYSMVLHTLFFKRQLNIVYILIEYNYIFHFSTYYFIKEKEMSTCQLRTTWRHN